MASILPIVEKTIPKLDKLTLDEDSFHIDFVNPLDIYKSSIS